MLVGEQPGRPGTLSLAAYQEIVTSSDLGELIATTITFAGGATLVGLVLGGVLAWCVERTNAPLRQISYPAIFVSFAVPGIVRAIGWILLLGPRTGSINELFRALTGSTATLMDVFSLPVMIVVEGVFWIPLVFLMMSASFRSMDPSLEEAAMTSGATTWRTIRRVTAAVALPSVLSVIILTFIRSVQAFEVPLLLGVPAKAYTVTTVVYLNVTSGIMPDYSYSAAYGVLLVAFLVAAITLYGRVTRRASSFATITGKAFRPRVLELGRGRWIVTAIVLSIVALQFLPILAILWASLIPSFGLPGAPWDHLTLGNYRTVLADPQILLSLQDSFSIGILAATGVMAVTAVVAWVLVRARIRGTALLDQLASMPLVLPGVVLGIAVLVTYIRSPIPVYGTIWILVIAYMTTYLPYGLRYAHPGMLRIHPELEESAQLSGAGWGGTFRKVVVPLLLPALFAGWVFVFLISVRELSVAALLYTPRSPVIATTMLDLWTNGSVNQVTALGSLVAAISITFAVFTYRVSRRFGLQA
ncbi:MAG: iron ABC transporter permease [Chloroflexota bacterium]|nr:iron ABC transporter permease [Chloroflexota bacterium]MDE3193104.1 iron ABC transporter permease [Chloroflexota bacterium]